MDGTTTTRLRVPRRPTLAVLVAVCVAAAACSPPRDASGGGQTVRVVLADDWATVPAVVDAIHAFEQANPGVRVEVTDVPFGEIDEAVAAAPEGTYDLVHGHAFAAAAVGHAERVDDLWEAHLDPGEFVPGAVRDVTWRGMRVGIPLDTNVLLLLVDRSTAADAGLDLDRPLTFADIEELGRHAREAGALGTAFPTSSWRAFGWIRANGGELVTIDESGQPTFTLDSDEVVQALDLFGRMIADGRAVATDSSGDAAALFENGETVFHASGAWDAVGLDPAEVATLPLPRGPSAGASGGSVLGGSSLYVARGSTNRELAFQLAVTLIDDEFALRYAREEGRLPVRPRVLERFDQPALRTARTQLEDAAVMELIAFPEAAAAFDDAIARILSGEATAAEALADAQRTATAGEDGT